MKATNRQIAEYKEQLADYRAYIRQAEQAAQEHYDKTVLSLSGGALGISFAFIKDVIGQQLPIQPWLLLAAWLCWGASSTGVLASYYTSHMCLRKVLRQIEERPDELCSASLGGKASAVTSILNAAAGILFFVGVVLLTFFVCVNWR